MELEIRGLAAGYDGKRIISDINAQLSRGQIMGVIGPNGAGKTTFLRTLAGFLKPMAGEALLDGESIHSMSPAHRARRISVLPAAGKNPPAMSCFQVAAMGRYPYTGPLGGLGDKDEEAVMRALSLTDSADLAGRDFTRLSDGQKQRVLIARALAQEPSLLILDEPTAFLDIRYRMEILALLQKLAAGEGMMIIISIHSPALALALSHRILALREGSLFAFGEPDELEGRIGELFDMDRISFDPEINRKLMEAGYGI